jgi:hypothetical protein
VLSRIGKEAVVAILGRRLSAKAPGWSISSNRDRDGDGASSALIIGGGDRPAPTKPLFADRFLSHMLSEHAHRSGPADQLFNSSAKRLPVAPVAGAVCQADPHRIRSKIRRTPRE